MEKPRLYTSLRSPFGRRIRLLLEEIGIEHEVELVDVFNLPASFLEINPLGRVPVLVLSTGESLIDSTEIYAHIEKRYGANTLFASWGAREGRLREIRGLCLGVMELAVLVFLETLRPPGQQLPTVREEHLEALHRALKRLETHVKGPLLLGESLSAADLDLGAALSYCDLRLGTQVVDRYASLRACVTKLNQRPSFKKTIPPQ